MNSFCDCTSLSPLKSELQEVASCSSGVNTSSQDVFLSVQIRPTRLAPQSWHNEHIFTVAAAPRSDGKLHAHSRDLVLRSPCGNVLQLAVSFQIATSAIPASSSDVTCVHAALCLHGQLPSQDYALSHSIATKRACAPALVLFASRYKASCKC